MKYNLKVDNLLQYRLPAYDKKNSEFTNCDLNESLFPLPVGVQSLRIESDDIKNYPRYLLNSLTQEVAEYLQMSEKNILVYNGSDTALESIFTLFCTEDSLVITVQPDYNQVDSYINSKTNRHIKVLDPAPLESSTVTEYNFTGADIVYFSNPCNPTGKIIPKEIVISWLTKHKETLFVIDEAYFEFYGKTLVGEINNFKNLIVTRSFSKAFGLAGLRLGYLVANKDFIEKLSKIRSEKNITNFSIKAGIISLQDLDNLHRNVKALEFSRSLFYELLDSRILSPRSFANFVLIKCNDSEKVMRKLNEYKINARDRSIYSNLQNCIRITLGPTSLVKTIIKILNENAI